LGGVIVHLQLARNASAIAREGARFWIVQPEIGFGGISGLDTLLSGAHLTVRLGHGPAATDFRGLDAPPATEKTDEGRAFFLQSDRLGGLQLHAPVFYRDVKVGEVETARLGDDATGVWIRIRVQRPYVDLIRANTRFWNAGGAPLQISLFGGGSQRRSLQSILTGAIAFATPEEPSEPAPEGAQFPLAKEADEDWLKWRPRIPINALDAAPEKPAPSKVVPGLLGG
jgi:paraquat-inducible protein B